MNAHQCDILYSEPLVASLQTTLSPGRLVLYRELAHQNTDLAFKLYCWNATLSQALHWPLHVFEVSLRNAMADRIATTYGPKWFDRISSLSSQPSQATNDEDIHVQKAKKKLKSEGLANNHDNIVAAVSLGFWLGLLKLEYQDKLWEQLFSNLFHMDRGESYRKVNQIKRLRNTIAHHEPVLVFLPSKDKRRLYQDYKLILKIVRWICPDTARWVEHHSSADFYSTWNSCPAGFTVSRLSVSKPGDEIDSTKWKF